ncbi:alcohol dehydrogenase catalytic domain-containing protein [Candidatus Bipolaricaulota bacterium]|nr:alcohol dehydrogenase catalytic domain-containing protein [Candidatus Bipolaricaulota bacterium]
MRAARIFGEKDIRYVEKAKPTVGPEEVLVKVKAVGVCGSDVELYEGVHPYLERGLTTLPITPGHEWSGRVAETGDKVEDFSPGDRVTGDVTLACGDCEYCMNGRYNLCPNRIVVGSYRNKEGGFAEYIKMPRRHLYEIPEGVSYREAAMTEPAATCVYGVNRTDIEFGSSVFVVGDGAIGQLALQSAAAGAGKVIISGSYDQKLDIAADLYGAETINRHEHDVVDRVKELTKNEGVDVVLEASGNDKGLDQGLEALRPGGKICLLSIYPQEELTADINSVVFKDADLYGVLGSPGSFSSTLEMMAKDKLKPEELISHTVSLENAEKAFDFVYNDRENTIKTIIEP